MNNQNSQYGCGFFLDGRKGNNAFSYEKRRIALGKAPRLWVPPLIYGCFDDVKKGNKIVFEDFDENGDLQSCVGLEKFVRMEFGGVEMVIVDNHNHALYFWYEAFRKGKIGGGASLVHIDQHKDMRAAEVAIGSVAPPHLFQFVNEQVNVGNYIVPATKQGLIGETVFVTSESALIDALDNKRFFDETNKILNIDLDFFAPELSYVDFEKAKAFILEHAKKSGIITVATSPFFIDQDLAIRTLKELFSGRS